MSAELTQAGAHGIGAAALQQSLGLRMRALPDRRRGGKTASPADVRTSRPAAFVVPIDLDLQKPAASERLEIGGQRGAVERQQVERQRRWSAARRG